MFVLKAYASGGSGNAAYTRAATRQAIASGMSPAQARATVRRNANTRTRTSSRENYVNRLGINR